ncbi:MAG: hypothetical protein IKS19_02725 [Clostridia bacterium]|nr:hypothetical protein [Clostridia bacterium]
MNKMDSIDKTSAVYRKIYKWSAVLFGALALVYYYFKTQYVVGENLFARIFFQIFSLGVLASLSYTICQFIGERMWISRNKNIFIKGTWLHIHVKNGVATRIGKAEIKQSFFTISVTGHNTQFKTDGTYDADADSDWKYYMGAVYNDATKRDYIGCYSKLGRHGNCDDGLHEMTIEQSGSGFPNRIYGHFLDTFAIDDSIRDTENHKGEILMFRLSEPLRNYLYTDGRFDYEKLSGLIGEAGFSNEPYVKELLKYKNRIDAPEK